MLDLLVGAIGVLLVVLGIGLVSVPAALIALGGALVLVALLVDLSPHRKERGA